MMVNELKNVGEWIHKTIAPVTLLNNPPSAEQLADWRNFITGERKRISENLLATVPILAEPEGTRYVRNNQKNVLILSEVLHDYQLHNEHDCEVELIELYQFSCEKLDEILDEMHRFYPCYFDASLPVTYTIAVKKREALLDLHRGINHLVCNAQKDAELWDIILKPVVRFLSNLERPITFHIIKYYEILLVKLSVLTEVDAAKDADGDMHDVLLTYNFNDPDYVQYYAGLIASVAAILSKTRDRITKLHWYRKMIRQHHTEPGVALLPGIPSLPDQLATWLDEEIHYWQQQLAMEDTPQSSTGIYLEHKIRLSLSVTELAVLIALLDQCGAFKRINFTDILRVVAHTFATTGTEEISVKSLRSKAYSYKQDRIAAVKVRKLLLDCAALLAKELPGIAGAGKAER